MTVTFLCHVLCDRHIHSSRPLWPSHSFVTSIVTITFLRHVHCECDRFISWPRPEWRSQSCPLWPSHRHIPPSLVSLVIMSLGIATFLRQVPSLTVFRLVPSVRHLVDMLTLRRCWWRWCVSSTLCLCLSKMLFVQGHLMSHAFFFFVYNFLLTQDGAMWMV